MKTEKEAELCIFPPFSLCAYFADSLVLLLGENDKSPMPAKTILSLHENLQQVKWIFTHQAV